MQNDEEYLGRNQMTQLLPQKVAALTQKCRVILQPLTPVIGFSMRVLWLYCTRSVFPAFISEHRQEVSRRLTRSELDMTHKLYTRRGVCMLMAHCSPVYCMRGLETLGPVYMGPHCRGRERQEMNVSAWKGGVLKKKQGEGFPAIGPVYRKCKEILGLSIPFWSCVQLTCPCSEISVLILPAGEVGPHFLTGDEY